jgi:DNA anti-recombination protein RmuC
MRHKITNALRGIKTQGRWGEMILESILENQLVKDRVFHGTPVGR